MTRREYFYNFGPCATKAMGATIVVWGVGNAFRIVLGQNCFSILFTVCIERDLTNNINTQTILNKFVNQNINY